MLMRSQMAHNTKRCIIICCEATQRVSEECCTRQGRSQDFENARNWLYYGPVVQHDFLVGS